jgi:general transcriptional corepressor CYC8
MATNRYVCTPTRVPKWLTTYPGSLNELTGDLEGAFFAYDQALRHNSWSTQTLNAISTILRTKEDYPKAMEYLKKILQVEPANGDAWGNLGHCYLMLDNLQEAYTAYQQALYYLPDPKVCSVIHFPSTELIVSGAKALVWHRYSL